MLRDPSCDAFADGPDVAAILDRSGTVVAVNHAWSEHAQASGSDRGCGVGADYVEVCRTGVAMRAPGAHRAHESVRSVLTGQRAASSSTYPCGGPRGLRWYRSDVFALRGGSAVCVRHLDVTDQPPAGASGELASTVLHRDERTGFQEGLAELMGRAATGQLMVLVCAVAGDPPDDDDRTASLVQLAVVRVAGAAVRDLARVELAARLSAGEIAVAVSGPTLGAVVGAADTIRTLTAGHLRDRPRWGFALATGVDRDPATLVGRARQAVHDVDVAVARGPGPFVDAMDRAAALHRSALRLSDAVTEFDAALDQGLPLADLVWRDQEVTAAERECVRAAAAAHLR